MENLIEHVIESAKYYADNVSDFIEHSSELFMEAMLSFDLGCISKVKDAVTEAIGQVDEYLVRLEIGYNKTIIVLKRLAPEEDTTDQEILLWDIKRPILYRKQELEELQKTIEDFSI